MWVKGKIPASEVELGMMFKIGIGYHKVTHVSSGVFCRCCVLITTRGVSGRYHRTTEFPLEKLVQIKQKLV